MELVNDDVILDEDIKIIFEDTLVKIFNYIEPDYENNCMKGITLNECIKIAKNKGYNNGTILVISESYLDGSIYRYNNYNENEWYKVGKMSGFA